MKISKVKVQNSNRDQRKLKKINSAVIAGCSAESETLYWEQKIKVLVDPMSL